VIAFYVIIFLKTGIYATGTLPSITGLAAEVMTAALLAALFAAYYVYGETKCFVFWVGLATIPIIAMTRMGMVAASLTLPLTFAPLKFYKRLTISFAIVVVGVSLFYTERFQKRMFYSEQGSINEVRLDNPNFRTTGRMALWKLMDQEIQEKPWFGHGANAQEDFITFVVGFPGQPHNDWKRLLFDYGYVGTLIFGLCIAMQMFHAWKKGRITNRETRILFYAGASSFLPFVVFMLTDNIILYAAFFGNLQFTILGLAYASLKTSMKDAAMARSQTLTINGRPILLRCQTICPHDTSAR
jgi:O-antigen ligase